MKPYVLDGTVKQFELWNPNDLGYLAGYAAADLASGKASLTTGSTFDAGKLKTYTVLAPAGTTGPSVVLGPPTVFDASNVGEVQLLVTHRPSAAGTAPPCRPRFPSRGRLDAPRLFPAAGRPGQNGRIPATSRRGLARDAGRADRDRLAQLLPLPRR